MLYSFAFDTDAHVGYLVRIDPATGVGTRVSGEAMPHNVWIVGMAYNQQSGGFCGVSSGFAVRNFQELYAIAVAGGDAGGRETDNHILYEVSDYHPIDIKTSILYVLMHAHYTDARR